MRERVEDDLHLAEAQFLAGLDGCAASRRREAGLPDLLRCRLVHVHEIRQDLADDVLRFADGHVGRHLDEAELALATHLHVEAKRGEELLMRLDELRFLAVKRQDLVDKQLLRRDVARHRRELVEEDALVRCMLVDDVEPLGVLRDDVGQVNLADWHDRTLVLEPLSLFSLRARRLLRR